jgi:enamine deaminase RidA (YjgF/YER057c/UK114 family)
MPSHKGRRMRFAIALLGSGLLLAIPPRLTAEDLRDVEPNEATGSSGAVVVGDLPLAHTTQLLSVDARGVVVGKNATEQCEKLLDQLGTMLADVGGGLDRLVKLNVYATRLDDVAAIEKVIARRFRGGRKPAVCFVVTRLPSAEALVGLDAVSVAGERRPARDNTKVAVLPAGSRVYVSGQAERADSLAEATRKTLEALRVTLQHVGLNESQIVQFKAFLRPATGAADVHAEMAKFFGTRPLPPVAFVEWDSPLPIEIEVIAAGGPAQPGEPVEYMTPPALRASPVFSRVARINHGPTIYLSGMYGDGGDAAAQVTGIFTDMGRLLGKCGGDLRHLVKATYYVATPEASKALDDLRPRFYDPQRPPAASKAKVAGTGRVGRDLTLDMIAVPAAGTR